MTDPKIPVTEDELHAYVDNELPAERSSDVEAWLASHPDDAARVQSWRAMADALHARYDSVVDEAVPKRLEIERLVQQPRRWVYGAIAATLAAFIVGGSVGHGIGLSLHEGPGFRAAGDAVMVEDGVYMLQVGATDAKAGNALLSAMVRSTAKGAEVLIRSPSIAEG